MFNPAAMMFNPQGYAPTQQHQQQQQRGGGQQGGRPNSQPPQQFVSMMGGMPMPFNPMAPPQHQQHYAQYPQAHQQQYMGQQQHQFSGAAQPFNPQQQQQGGGMYFMPQ